MKHLFANLGFKIHFAAYVGVNLMLIAVNLLLTPQVMWFYWVVIGWGIGVVAHGLAIEYAGKRRATRSAHHAHRRSATAKRA
jgi:hypothetical protein